MLNELTPEQIAAIGTAVAAVVGAIGFWAHRSANRPVAPVSANGPPGTVLFVNDSKVGALLAAIDMLTTVVLDKKLTLEKNTDAIKAHHGVVEMHRQIVETNVKHAQALNEHAERLAREMRELRERTEALRDETKDLRDEMLRRGSR